MIVNTKTLENLLSKLQETFPDFTTKLELLKERVINQELVFSCNNNVLYDKEKFEAIFGVGNYSIKFKKKIIFPKMILLDPNKLTLTIQLQDGSVLKAKAKQVTIDFDDLDFKKLLTEFNAI